MKRFGVAALALGLALLLAGCGAFVVEIAEAIIEQAAVSGISSLGLDLSGGTVVRDEDSHGGFHGDGSTFTVMTFDPEDLDALEANMKGEYWRPLPMTENVARAARSLAEEENGESFFPAIEQGYYYFRDRHSESLDPGDDSELFQRASYNFTMALYDSETGTLYFFELDT